MSPQSLLHVLMYINVMIYTIQIHLIVTLEL